jgi:hypothetical protein
LINSNTKITRSIQSLASNTLQKINVQSLQASLATGTLTGNQNIKATYNKFIQPTGNNAFSFSGLWFVARRLMTAFTPPLRCGGNAALSGRAWFSPQRSGGVNQALEQTPLRGPLSAALATNK